MKKYFCILLSISIMLSIFPFAYAEETTPQTEKVDTTPKMTQSQDVPIPTPIATSTVTFEYTQGNNTVEETVTVKVTDLSGNKSDDDNARAYETTMCTESKKTKDDLVSTETTHSIFVTGGEGIITQSGNLDSDNDKKIIDTVVSDPKTVIECEDKSFCTNHQWDEGTVIQEASCCRAGIRRYSCTYYDKETEQRCTAVKYEELPKTDDHEIDQVIATVDCVENKYRIYKCVNKGCGELLKVNDSSISKGTHNYVDGICTKCGDVVKTQGTVDNGPTYSYENCVLIVNGSGAIPDYKITVPDSEKQQTDIPLTELTPWRSFANKIIEIIIGSGITKIGDFAFANLLNLQQVDIYSKNVTIGDYAFAGDSNLADVNYMNKEAKPTLQNSNARVTYVDDAANTSESRGSTAFAGSGKVSVNYSCVDPYASELKSTQEYAFATIGHTDLHLNCATLPGVAPTETEFGKTEGVYCNDCKKTIVIQQKIYPNGKQETGEYKIKALSEMTNVPKNLTDAKYNTLDKIAELTEKYKTAMEKEYLAEFETELQKDNSAIYNVELVKSKTETPPKTHVINIPYPSGTNPDTSEFLVLQMDSKDKIEKVDTFLTNKGIQIETETLMPVAVAWNNAK